MRTAPVKPDDSARMRDLLASNRTLLAWTSISLACVMLVAYLIASS